MTQTPTTIPGPGLLYAIPAARTLLRDPREMMNRYAAKYGPVFRTHFPSRGRLVDLVWLLGPEGNERILAPHHRDDFSWYEAYRFTMESMFGRDILLLRDGERHRERHRQLVPAFHPRNDADYIAEMRRIVEGRFRSWRNRPEFDLARELKRIAFHIVANLLFGAEDDEIAELVALFEEVGLGLFSVFRVPLPGFHYYSGLRARKRLGTFVQRKIEQYRHQGIPRNMLGSLMKGATETGLELPDDSLVAEVIAFLYAGYDTTASFLTSFWVAVLERPELCEALRVEAQELSDFTYPSMLECKQLERALLETERLFPPLLFNLRGVLRDFDFHGFSIRRGSMVAYSSYFTGRLPSLWEAADQFLPDRFQGNKKISPYAMVGFGGGARACIGKRFALLEMRLVISLMMRNFRFIPRPNQSDETHFSPAMERKHGYSVTAHALQSGSPLPE